MGKKKQKTTNTYQYMPRPETQDTINARNALQSVDFSTPVLNSYGQMENLVMDDAFYEDALPEGAREKIKLGKLFNLKMQKGAALGDAKAREHEFKTTGMMNLANMTQAPLVQTGGTVTQSGGILGGITNLASGAGSVMSGMGSMGVT